MADNIILSDITITARDKLVEILTKAGGGGAAGGGSTGGGSSGTQNQTKAVEGNIRAVKAESEFRTKAKNKLKQFGEAVTTTAGNLQTMLGGTLMEGVLKEFRTGVAGGAEAVDNLSGYINRQRMAYEELGITVEELHDFNKASRAASNNLGGLDNWSVKLAENQSHYYARIGDLTKAAEHQAEMMETLVHTGVSATDFAGKFGKQLDKVNDDLLTMGISYEESRAMFQEAMEDEDVRRRLQSAASGQQRKQIMLEVQGRMAHFKALGMSTEQAKAASKALEQLGGKKPLDRFKQAAKAQAALTAMGVDGASEVGDIIRKGARATEEERARLQEVFGAAQDAAAEAATGSLSQEMFVRGMLEKSGLEDLPNMSTKLTENAKFSKEQLDVAAKMGKDTATITKTMMTVDKLNNALNNNPWISGSFQMLTAIWGTITAWWAFTKAGAAIKFLAPYLAPVAAIGIAAFATWQGIKALVTGSSDLFDWLQNAFPNFTKSLADVIGQFVDRILATVGWGQVAEDAENRLKLAEDQKKRDEAAEKRKTKEDKKKEKVSDQQLAAQKEGNGLLSSLMGSGSNMPSFGGGGDNTKLVDLMTKNNELLEKMVTGTNNMASGMGREGATVPADMNS